MITALLGDLLPMLGLSARKYKESMENTSCGNNCPFVKNGLCKTDEECCNYVESWWQANGTDKPVLVKDCSKKRMLFMQQDQVSYTLHLQQEINSLKQEVQKLSDMLISLIQRTHYYLEESAEKNLISKD